MRRWAILLVLAVALLAQCDAGVEVAVIPCMISPTANVPAYLAVEFYSDSLVHFEISTVRSEFPSGRKTIYTTQMVGDKASVQFPGPKALKRVDAPTSVTFTTQSMVVIVDRKTMVITLNSLTGMYITKFSFANLNGVTKDLLWDRSFVTDVYGLGSHFMQPYGSSDGNFAGKAFTMDDSQFGNQMQAVYQSGQWRGMAAMTLFPMMYALGPDPSTQIYGLFLDNQYRKEWHFTGNPYRASMWGDQIRWFFFYQPSLLQIRQQYLLLTGGTSPMPPRRMFGLWQSIFGYRSWDHIDNDIGSLVAPSNKFERFPVDGVAMDIYWFGGKFFDPDTVPKSTSLDQSRMGDLHWDESKFPDPSSHLAAYKKDKGITFMLIEESYISQRTKAYGVMDSKGMLAKDGAGKTFVLDKNWWWGVGGMADWTNKETRDFWFDCKHCPLIRGCDMSANKDKCAGVLFDRSNPSKQQGDISAFWTDLGEPEMFDANFRYAGYTEDTTKAMNQHGDYHNLHQLYWLKGLSEGYRRNNIKTRPWFLTRSGTSGLHRYGTSMWSGDIWPSLEAMASSLNMQMHMSLVGIDYYGSDIGGFQRKFFEQNQNEKFTQWFANSAWFDVPVRPHTWQADGSPVQTAPSRVGDKMSNLFNIRTRVSLVPYYYSLAYRVWQFGEPLVPPMVFYYPKDPNVRQAGHQKFIGPSILVALSATEGQRSRRVYLPAGKWINYHTHELKASKGEWFETSQLIYREQYCAAPGDNCLFTVPAFVKAGAIIPHMLVDQFTRNALGERDQDPEKSQDVFARVYPVADTPGAGKFTLYEDDGETVAYQSKSFRTTDILMDNKVDKVTVSVKAASGTFAGSVTARQTTVQLVPAGGQKIKAVSCNGKPLTLQTSQSAFDGADSGYLASSTRIDAKCGRGPVNVDRVFVFTRA